MNVDISAMGYQQWIRFLFDHSVPENTDHEDPWHFNITCEVSRPKTLVAHATRLCREMPRIGKRYTPEQIDEGIWCLLGSDADLNARLLDATVPLDARTSCIQSMYDVFEAYVPTLQTVPTCFTMWWDLVCDNGFWSTVRSRLHSVNIADIDPQKLIGDAVQMLAEAEKLLSGELVTREDKRQAHFTKSARECAAMISQFTPDEQAIFETLLATLERILAIPNDTSQYSALHGLGHLHHPRVKQIVTKFAETQARDWSDEDKLWLRQCADCRIM